MAINRPPARIKKSRPFYLHRMWLNAGNSVANVIQLPIRKLICTIPHENDQIRWEF